jgi:TonB-dependent SusC/RagA subfamily outer membrane receptor
MRNLLFLLLLVVSTQLFGQRTPTVTVKDSSQLKLSKLEISVNIVGNLATTRYYMKFYNGLDRTLEGELAFPLGQGQSVSWFAMDLRGELREAVIVEKQLARVAYETTVRQNIDPALLEKTSGNNYKARVYPILPKDFKTIVLKYEETLSSVDGKLTYTLPLGIEEVIDDFELEVKIFGPQNDIKVQGEMIQESSFQPFTNGKRAIITREKVTPKKPITIEIDNPIGEQKVYTSEDYFYGYIPLQSEFRNKKKPKNITLLWDTSYSMRNRELEKELELLDQYFKDVQNVKVDYIAFSNDVHKKETFVVSNGNWSALKKEMESSHYDGGTNLELFKNQKFRSDEILLFSDGLANLGEASEFKKRPVYPINSLTSADHTALEQLATQSGGLYINLNKVSPKKASELLQQETLQFLGIKSSNYIYDIYPNQRTNVIGDFTFTGRYEQYANLQLQFGYRGRVTKTVSFHLKNAKGANLAKRMWAKEKLKSLLHQKEKNKNEIISLSKEYYLITDYTSMLILDRIEDYVQYKIEPPKELLAEYKKLLKERAEFDAFAQEEIEDRRAELPENYKEITDWYQDSFPKKKKKKKQSTQTNNTNTQNTTNTNTRQRNNIVLANVDRSKRVIQGTVIDNTNEPLPGTSITIKGTTRGTETDFDGNYAINAEQNEVLVFSFLGFKTKEVQVADSNTINVKLREDAEVLEEVVTIGYGTTNRSQGAEVLLLRLLQGNATGVTVTQATGTTKSVVTTNKNASPLYIVDGVPTNKISLDSLSSDNVDSMQVLKDASATAIYGSRASNGIIIITTQKGKETNKKRIEEFNAMIADKIELKPWNPKTPYINILQKETSVAAAYAKYLTIRNDYSNSPMFFVDVADFFDQKNARDIAIRVLTNLVEIEIDNYELIKALAYKLEYFEQYDLAKKMYQKVLDLRPEEPQSYRDLALACELAGDYQQSFDLLYKIYSGELVEKDLDGRYDGIESVAFVELTRLVSKYGHKLQLNKNQRKFFKEIPVDVRIVVDWNHNDTDIDLWVTDPRKEKAYYKNTETAIGGRMSHDMMEGYGPEEFMLKDAMKGTYQIKVDYYSDNVQKISGPPILKVTMYTNYGKKNEKRKMIVVKLDKEEDTIEVGNVSFD